MTDSAAPRFWRDARLPHLELRQIEDGRRVCYAPHSHEQWSLGAITAGESTFHYREARHHVREGQLVLMNPGWVHACNPIDDRPWAYRMLYVETAWLTRIRQAAGLIDTPRWQDIPTAVIAAPEWYAGYCRMTDRLLDPHVPVSEKQAGAEAYLAALMRHLAGQPAAAPAIPSATLVELAAFLDAHAAQEVSLAELCARSGYSAGHLIRAFKRHFGLTPRAYLINRRVQLGQQALKRGVPIAEAALHAGFSDQPHFQRTFKRLVAATPNQYRRPLAK